MLRKNNIAALASVLALCGCMNADNLNNRDTITLGAGNAVDANIGIHTIDPFPANASDTDIELTGKKVGDAYGRYLEPCDPDIVACTVSTADNSTGNVNAAQAQ